MLMGGIPTVKKASEPMGRDARSRPRRQESRRSAPLAYLPLPYLAAISG